MKVTSVSTTLVSPKNPPKLEDFLDESLNYVSKKSVLAITSKVVAICEDRSVPISQVDKNELIKRESDYYLPSQLSKYDFTFTIAHNTLIPSAGIDESNGDGYYILWPEDPINSANQIRKYLQKRFGLTYVGVIITDSTARPLHYGTDGVAIGFSGFLPNYSYVGKPDLFGREQKVSIANHLDALAAAAVVVMGEGDEKTPIGLIEDVPFIKFVDHNPTENELKNFFISHIDDDLYAPFLKNAQWKKGNKN